MADGAGAPMPGGWSWRALREELKTALLHLTLAGCVYLLPRGRLLPVIRRLAGRHAWFMDAAARSSRMQQAFADRPIDPAQASRAIAMHSLLDLADYYLTGRYGTDWMEDNLVVAGVPPPTHAGALFFTLHYGQGFWALKHFRQRGLPLAWLHLPPPASAPPGERIARWLACKRIRRVGALSGAPVIPTGGSVAIMRQRLCQQGLPVLAMPDAPLHAEQGRVPVTLLGRPAALPSGALELATRENIPVYIYTIAADLATGKRHLHLHGPFLQTDAAQLGQALADILTAAIRHDPHAWHGWPWLDSFLPAAESGDKTQAESCQ